MSLRNKIGILVLILGLIGSVAAVSAQTPASPNTTGAQQPDRAGMGRRGMRRGARMGRMHALSQLNLTDEQKQQMRTIIQNQGGSTKAQREEMFQLMQQRRAGTLTPEGEKRAMELRQQLRESRKGTHTQMMNILTAEQKAKLEEMKKARRANHEKFGKQRQLPN